MARNNSYVSLQPPPGRRIDDKIQFESIDLYLWTGPEFRTPSVLFYSGAACSMINNDVYNSDVSKVYISSCDKTAITEACSNFYNISMLHLHMLANFPHMLQTFVVYKLQSPHTFQSVSIPTMKH